MTDVVEIARKLRAELAAEIARLDRFLRMAAALQKYENGAAGSDRIKGGELDTEMPFPGETAAAQRVSAVPTPVPVPTPARTPEPPRRAAEVTRETIPDHFLFADKEDEVLVLEPQQTESRTEATATETAATPSPGSVDIHVGQKLRQRRWMIGMSRQQLGDAIGVGLDQIRNYEMGTEHVGPSRMWQIAAALDVPMSYFFEEIEGQSDDGESARSSVIGESEALRLLEEGEAADHPVRTAKAS